MGVQIHVMQGRPAATFTQCTSDVCHSSSLRYSKYFYVDPRGGVTVLLKITWGGTQNKGKLLQGRLAVFLTLIMVCLSPACYVKASTGCHSLDQKAQSLNSLRAQS